MRLSLLILAIATTVLAQGPTTPTNPCPDMNVWRCCTNAVDPTDPSVAGELSKAGVDPSTLTGKVGTGCEDAGGDTDCPGTQYCCTEPQIDMLVVEGIDINCQAVPV